MDVLLVIVGILLARLDDHPQTPSGPDPAEHSAVSAPSARAQRTAEAFDDFALGRRDSAPFAEEVRVHVGGVETARLDRSSATRRASWRTCPPGELTVFERACPVSPLDTLTQLSTGEGIAAVVERGAPRIVGCQPVVEPLGAGHVDVVSLRPPPTRPDLRSCFADFAVTLYLDRRGDVRAVNLVISSP